MITREPWSEHFLESLLWRPSTFAMMMLFTIFALVVILLLFNIWLKRRFNRRLGTLAFFVVLLAIWVGGWYAIGAGERFMDIVHALGLSILVFILLMFGETMMIMQTSMKDTLYEEYVLRGACKRASGEQNSQQTRRTHRHHTGTEPVDRHHPYIAVRNGDD